MGEWKIGRIQNCMEVMVVFLPKYIAITAQAGLHGMKKLQMEHKTQVAVLVDSFPSMVIMVQHGDGTLEQLNRQIKQKEKPLQKYQL